MKPIVLVSLLSFAASCSDSPPAAPAVPAVAPTAVADSSLAAGAVRGVVVFDGEAPARKPVPMGGVAGCSGHGAVLTESVIVADGKLANVLVHVKQGVDTASAPPAPTDPVVLEQRGCVYTPHVLALRVGQPLHVVNADTFNHNVNAKPKLSANTAFNRTQVAGAHDEVMFTAGELEVPFACDIHPWMKAYVHALEHPYFALSASDGSFEIRGLAPGKYKLEAVHEKLGRQLLDLVVDAAAGTRVEFHYRESR